MISRKVTVFLGILMSALVFTSQADSLTIASGKVGVGFIPDGKIFGGNANIQVGPFSYFTEFFKKSGTTTVNFGGNIFHLKVPTPGFQPYFECGGGISRSSGGGISKTRLMANAAAGAEMGLGRKTDLFGQVKYLHIWGQNPRA